MHFWQVLRAYAAAPSSPVKPLFHGRHAGVYEQKALIVLRHEREARQSQMALAFKKLRYFSRSSLRPVHSVKISLTCRGSYPFKRNGLEF